MARVATVKIKAELNHRLLRQCNDLIGELGKAQLQIEAMTPNYRLGGLVRRMPSGSFLFHSHTGNWHFSLDPSAVIRSIFKLKMIGNEPEAALCEALGEQDAGTCY